MRAIRSQITDTEIAGGGVGLVKNPYHPRDRKYAEASTIFLRQTGVSFHLEVVHEHTRRAGVQIPSVSLRHTEQIHVKSVLSCKQWCDHRKPLGRTENRPSTKCRHFF
jgi:hypothetical protein